MQDKYKDKSKIALCRCWKSKKFPYCDGSHREYNQISGEITTNTCLETDACGICDAEGFSDVYPRLDDCDESCSGTTNYYAYNGATPKLRNCSDLKVLQDIIDLNIKFLF